MNLTFIMPRNSKFGRKMAYEYASSKICVGNIEFN